MAEIKSHEFDRFTASSAKLYKVFVIYGPDRGLVSERAKALAEASGVVQDDPFAMLKLDIGDLNGDPGRLLDEVNSLGLFGGSKLIWLRGAANEQFLLDALQHLENEPSADNSLIIEAGDLKKGTGLRKLAEPARSIAIIACYADDLRALNSLIDSELARENLGITRQARAQLLEQLGGDRIASRNEIAKLVLYCKGLPIIEEHHISDIIGDASSVSTDEAVDAVLSGDLEGLERALRKVALSKTPIFLILQACLKQFQLLDVMRAEMEERGSQPGQIMSILGRHVHFKRKPLLENALTKWPALALARDTERLQNAILQTRQRPALEDDIAMHVLMAISLQARR